MRRVPADPKARVVALVLDYGAACEAQGKAQAARKRADAHEATQAALITMGRIMDALDDLIDRAR